MSAGQGHGGSTKEGEKTTSGSKERVLNQAITVRFLPESFAM